MNAPAIAGARATRALLFPLAAAALLLLAGCAAVGPDHVPPSRDLPAGWREPAAGGLATTPAELDRWWQALGDPVLDDLVARAAAANLDHRAALARIAEARALRGTAAAARFPTIDAGAAYARVGQSENTPLGAFAVDAHRYSAGFDAAWEIDLWGRVRRSVEAADAGLQARIEDARDVGLAVAAEVARHYVELRAFQRRLELARTNLGLQERTLALAAERFAAGLVGERDVAQARTNVETTRSRLPALETGLHAAENRLAVLLAAAPGALAVELDPARPIPVPPLAIAVGVPADLLRRRADVRAAERALAAETARIGVALGDLYPRLTLAGNLGLEADDAGDLFERASGVFGFGPSLRWNLFDAGATRRRAAAQEARAEQARLRWESTVLLALEEAENAMTAFVREQVRRRSLADAAAAARQSVVLAQTQYQEGLADFQPVLDSQRALAGLEDDLAQSDAAITVQAIALYKALGGGTEHGATP